MLLLVALAPVAQGFANAPPDAVKPLLDKAHSAPVETRAPYLLEAADLALQQNQPDQAERILREIDELKLRDEQRARASILRAQLLMFQNKPEAALALLQSRELQTDSALLPAQAQAGLGLLRAQVFAANGNHYASAQERIFVDPLLKDAEREQNHREIQRTLMNLNAADLNRYRANASNEALRGWLELALAAKAGRADVADWSHKWPAHPATTQTIAGSKGFDTAALQQQQQIALLLPQSGKLANFGNAVRDGFLAASYEARGRNESAPIVRIYDTENTGIVALYQRALADGATLVIGPLEKNQVAQFYTQILPVPLLALNRADLAQPAPANLYQFALAPEDETAQLASFAARDQRNNALVIVTEDEAHSRELEAFTQRWQGAGGSIAATALYRDQQSLSVAIRTALNIPRSAARAKEMETLLNRNIESAPHRRRDIDMVFMLAKPTQARLIKPLLDFYYAGDLPIYSTSRIYNGYASANTDRDAEKVRFTDIPWVLQQSALKQKILATDPLSKNYLRLYALGIDSFMLYPRLHQMEMASDRRLPGQTGALSLDAERIVRRELPLVEMHAGVPRVIDGNGIITDNSDAGRDGNVEQQNSSQ